MADHAALYLPESTYYAQTNDQLLFEILGSGGGAGSPPVISAAPVGGSTIASTDSIDVTIVDPDAGSLTTAIITAESADGTSDVVWTLAGGFSSPYAGSVTTVGGTTVVTITGGYSSVSTMLDVTVIDDGPASATFSAAYTVTFPPSVGTDLTAILDPVAFGGGTIEFEILDEDGNPIAGSPVTATETSPGVFVAAVPPGTPPGVYVNRIIDAATGTQLATEIFYWNGAQTVPNPAPSLS